MCSSLKEYGIAKYHFIRKTGWLVGLYGATTQEGHMANKKVNYFQFDV